MKINRTGDCPLFVDYIIRILMVPHSGPLASELKMLTAFGGDRWIEIPSYQRGLVWDEEKLEELLESDSVFLGNAVLGQFPLPHRDHPPFSLLPEATRNYEILIDGLQRFSIGTALLNILQVCVLTDYPEFPLLAPRFEALKAYVLSRASVFQHNDRQLRNHPRLAVRESYVAFEERLKLWLRIELSSVERAEVRIPQLLNLFLGRQIAPDTFHGFKDEYDVTNTFIGLNTTRVQLHVMDWLRSIIIDLGGRAGWTPGQHGEIENRFTDVFYDSDQASPIKELEPFASIIKDLLVEPEMRTKVFPSLRVKSLIDDDVEDYTSSTFTPKPKETRGKLSFEEVENLLQFVGLMHRHEGDPYVREIRASGALPFACILAHYYRVYLALGVRPSFLEGDSSEHSDLHPFLKAIYRVLLDGRIGRIRDTAKRLLIEDCTLPHAADDLSRNFLSIPLSDVVDQHWLRVSLKKCDRRRSQRVFNACLLPPIENANSFSPQRYGSGHDCYQIDHLIPKIEIDGKCRGSIEADTIVNFAPIRGSSNNAQKFLRCSEKLVPGSTYSREVELTKDQAHPILSWLVDNQGPYGIKLDRKELLESNANPPIGDQRIEWLVERLSSTF